MGLLDVILGNMMGAGGASTQGRGGASSPIVKALMMLLAAKAYQHYRSRPQDGSLGGTLGGMLGSQGGGLGGGMSRGLGGGLSGGLGGLLGGLLGGGGLAQGGLGALLNQFRQNGYADHVD